MINNNDNYQARAFDYNSPELGRLNVLYQQQDREAYKSLLSRVSIIPEVTDKSGFNKLVQASPKVIHPGDENTNNKVLSLAEFKRDIQTNYCLKLAWLETYEAAKRKGLGRLSIYTGVRETDLSKDASLYADFWNNLVDWDNRVDFYKNTGFDNVPRKMLNIRPTVPYQKMSIKASKVLNGFDSQVLKPNERLTDYMLDNGKML